MRSYKILDNLVEEGFKIELPKQRFGRNRHLRCKTQIDEYD